MVHGIDSERRAYLVWKGYGFHDRHKEIVCFSDLALGNGGVTCIEGVALLIIVMISIRAYCCIMNLAII